MNELEAQIKNLETHIATRKAGLPHIDRGYYDEKAAIQKLEKKLAKLKDKNRAND